MMRRLGARLTLALVLGTAVSSLAGCEKDASGLTEWTPADHDHQTEPKRGRKANAANLPATPHAAPSQRNQVIDVTWLRQCSTCHGKRGRGDGPQSMMVKARDLSNPEWQASVTDDQLAKVIREGKDKMPAFNLPDNVITGLVAHVRNLARKPKTGGAPSDPDDDAPQGEPAATTPGADSPAAPNAPASTGAKQPSTSGDSDKPAQAPTAPAH